MYEVKYNNYYDGSPECEKYHGNTNQEELDEIVYKKWKNYYQTVEIKIYKNGVCIRTYPKTV